MAFQVVSADTIYTGDEILSHHAIIIEDDIIKEVIAIDKLPLTLSISQHFNNIAPAFIDLQIYGAGGKLLSEHPTAESLFILNDYCRKGGAAWFLPTVATNTYKVFYNCIDAVKAYRQQGGKGCLGLHVEGPWINPDKRGAHVLQCIHQPVIEEVRQLLEYGKGVIKMITLAPEVCGKDIIDLIESYGVIISAGHSNATYAQATTAFNNGIKTATHLYNAMSGLQHREPGIVGAVFNHNTVMASIVADGYHVNFEAISIAKKIMNERLFLITDAVTDTDTGFYHHIKNKEKYEANGVLSGSALTMHKAVKNCITNCNIKIDEALRMAAAYPANVVCNNSIGKIAPGYTASLIGFNSSFEKVAIIDTNSF